MLQKNFDILATFYIIILIVQNYFSDLYLAKTLDFSAKPFFPCKKYERPENIYKCIYLKLINSFTSAIHSLSFTAIARFIILACLA